MSNRKRKSLHFTTNTRPLFIRGRTASTKAALSTIALCLLTSVREIWKSTYRIEDGLLRGYNSGSDSSSLLNEESIFVDKNFDNDGPHTLVLASAVERHHDEQECGDCLTTSAPPPRITQISWTSTSYNESEHGNENQSSLQNSRNSSSLTNRHASSILTHRSIDEKDQHPPRQRKDLDSDGCVAMHPWQKTSFPTCLSLHEMDLSNLEWSSDMVTILSSGKFKYLWLMKEQIHGTKKRSYFAMKTLR